MQTIVSATREDSGVAVRLAVGDELRVTVPEREATAGWKAALEGSGLAASASSTEKGRYWEIGEDSQTSVHTFRATQEGHCVVTMEYQAMGPSGVRVLDTFSLEVVVGTPIKAKVERERLPLPEIAVMFVQFFLLSGVGFVISALAGLKWGIKSESPVEIFVGALGCVLFGAICIYVLLRFIRLLITKRFK